MRCIPQDASLATWMTWLGRWVVQELAGARAAPLEPSLPAAAASGAVSLESVMGEREELATASIPSGSIPEVDTPSMGRGGVAMEESPVCPQEGFFGAYCVSHRCPVIGIDRSSPIGDVWSIDAQGKALLWNENGNGGDTTGFELGSCGGSGLREREGVVTSSCGGALCLGTDEGSLLVCEWDQLAVGRTWGTPISLHRGGVLALEADLDTVVTGGMDGRVHVVDLSTRETLLEMAPHQGHQAQVGA